MELAHGAAELLVTWKEWKVRLLTEEPTNSFQYSCKSFYASSRRQIILYRGGERA